MLSGEREEGGGGRRRRRGSRYRKQGMQPAPDVDTLVRKTATRENLLKGS